MSDTAPTNTLFTPVLVRLRTDLHPAARDLCVSALDKHKHEKKEIPCRSGVKKCKINNTPQRGVRADHSGFPDLVLVMNRRGGGEGGDFSTSS